MRTSYQKPSNQSKSITKKIQFQMIEDPNASPVELQSHSYENSNLLLQEGCTNSKVIPTVKLNMTEFKKQNSRANSITSNSSFRSQPVPEIRDLRKERQNIKLIKQQTKNSSHYDSDGNIPQNDSPNNQSPYRNNETQDQSNVEEKQKRSTSKFKKEQFLGKYDNKVSELFSKQKKILQQSVPQKQIDLNMLISTKNTQSINYSNTYNNASGRRYSESHNQDTAGLKHKKREQPGRIQNDYNNISQNATLQKISKKKVSMSVNEGSISGLSSKSISRDSTPTQKINSMQMNEILIDKELQDSQVKEAVVIQKRNSNKKLSAVSARDNKQQPKEKFVNVQQKMLSKQLNNVHKNSVSSIKSSNSKNGSNTVKNATQKEKLQNKAESSSQQNIGQSSNNKDLLVVTTTNTTTSKKQSNFQQNNSKSISPNPPNPISNPQVNNVKKNIISKSNNNSSGNTPVKTKISQSQLVVTQPPVINLENVDDKSCSQDSINKDMNDQYQCKNQQQQEQQQQQQPDEQVRSTRTIFEQLIQKFDNEKKAYKQKQQEMEKIVELKLKQDLQDHQICYEKIQNFNVVCNNCKNNLDKKNQPKNSLDGGNCSANSSRHIKNTNNNIAKDRFNYMQQKKHQQYHSFDLTSQQQQQPMQVSYGFQQQPLQYSQFANQQYI